jgi:fermentation-respiration switch protein FrsA (DUF1100 family)
MGPGLYAQQSELAEAIAHMTTESSRPGSPVLGVVDTSKLALLGHSYGGACGMNAIREVCQPPFCYGTYARPAQLVAGAFWGTNLAMPLVGTVPVTENDAIPVALVQGTLDSMALPADAVGTYDKIQDPPKALVQVAGANHYGICDELAPPGADPDESAPALPLETSREVAARWTALFLRAHVLSDSEAFAWVHGGLGDPLDPFVTVSSVP